MLDDDEILDRVTYHAPSRYGIAKHARLTKVIAKAMQAVVDVVPLGREQALALTKLEEAKMWASAGVARNPDTR